MSDHLSHLAERAGSAPAGVRPALPSRFEPVKAGGAFTSLSTARITDPLFETEHDLPPSGEASEKGQSVHDRTASIQSILATAFTPATPVKGEPATERTSADLVRSPAAEPAMRAFAAESQAVVEPTAESPHKQPAVWPRTTQPAELTQRQPIVGDAKPASHPPASAERTPATHRAAPLLIPAIAPIPRAALASRESARAETAFVTDADSSPAPTIHVTIGRVEVRAIMPAAQFTPPPARSAPKLSLDDYLRSRNGAGA
ncbi:MAG: hypothetical protein NT154_06830 [Verrucomicrobia bacterium]|nr:hypothetical protein [Verrucomicrobiota bacterium]